MLTKDTSIDTHIGIIDKDSVRLVTPLLQQGGKVSEAFFLGDNTQIIIFERIKNILASRNVNCFFYEITSDPDYHLLVDNLQLFCKELNKKKRNILFNASCGLRFRLLSAYEVFKKYKWPTYVLELETNEICWLNNENNPIILSRKGNISVNEWLSVFGADSYEENKDTHRKNINSLDIELANKWALNSVKLNQAFGVLNFLATTCRKSGALDVTLSDKQLTYIELKEVLNDLKQRNHITMHGPTLTFANEYVRSFCNGQWLIDHVYHTLIELKDEIACINDVARNITFNRHIGNIAVKNKFDVATIVNNKLFIIECKTKSMKDVGDDTLYKLDSLREFIGGVQSKSMLITLKPLRASDITRSEDLGVKVVGPTQLADLRDELNHWIKNNKNI